MNLQRYKLLGSIQSKDYLLSQSTYWKILRHYCIWCKECHSIIESLNTTFVQAFIQSKEIGVKRCTMASCRCNWARRRGQAGLSMQSVQREAELSLAVLSLVGARVSRQQKGAACMIDHLRPFTISSPKGFCPVLAALAGIYPWNK